METPTSGPATVTANLTLKSGEQTTLEVPLSRSFSFKSNGEVVSENLQQDHTTATATYHTNHHSPSLSQSSPSSNHRSSWATPTKSTSASISIQSSFLPADSNESFQQTNQPVKQPSNEALDDNFAPSNETTLNQTQISSPPIDGQQNNPNTTELSCQLNQHLVHLQQATKAKQQQSSIKKSTTKRPKIIKSTFNQQFAMQSIQSLSMQLNTNQLPELASPDLGSPVANHLASGAMVDVNVNGAAPNQMSTGGSNKLTRLVGKKAARFKEILLQNLGRSDRTHDELFQLYEENFYKQQAQALKLQKEFKVYVNSLKGACEASKSLNNCIQQSTGDYQSARHDLVCENLNQLEHLSDDLMEKLRDQIVVSINEYLSQFSELRDKIAKRRRKLIDYDSSRRIYELMLSSLQKKRIKQQQQQSAAANQQQSTGGSIRSLRSAFSLSGSGGNLDLNQSPIDLGDTLQCATSQLVDEARLIKMREQFNYCKIMYESINSELHEELPMVYEKKMKHLLMTLQNYFSLEAQFNLNAGKLYATISDVVDELPMSIVNQQHNQQQFHHHGFHHNHHHTHIHSEEVDGQQVSGNGGEPEDVSSSPNGGYHKNAVSGASSSGMGSSRGDSSMESSSSPDNSIVGEIPITNNVKVDGSAAGNDQVVEDPDQKVVVAGSDVKPATESMGDKSKEVNEDQIQTAKVCEQIKKCDEPSNVAAPVEQKMEPKQSTEVVEAKQADGEPNSVAPIASRPNKDLERKSATVVSANEGSFLYKVMTNFKYMAEDVDELCFEADEIIQVIEFDEAHEPEDGWLLGRREVNGQVGLFPANFTRTIV